MSRQLFITWSPSQRSIDSASEVVQSINDLKLGTTIHGIAVDLTLPLAATDVVTECMKYYSYIDILVNNAGVELVRPFNATSLDEYNRVMDVNLRAPFLLIQAASPHLRGPARIINVSSIVARRAFATGAVYAASKAGLEAMTRCMAKELGKDGTTVNSVAPGIVQTDMVERAFSKEDLDMNAQGTPVGQRLVFAHPRILFRFYRVDQ